MQTGDEAEEPDAAVAQAVRLPSDDPAPLLFVAPAQQEIQLGMLRTVGMLAALRTVRTLTLMDFRILHTSLSHPWTGERLIPQYPEKRKLFLDDRLVLLRRVRAIYSG